MAVTLHTSQGDLKLELYCEEAPKTCENFLALCASSYYDATIFHRHIPGFMLQGGDPTGSGQGGRSIYDTPSGKFADEIVSGLSHDRAGIVSMANSGPNTNGSQFFVTFAAHTQLDGSYTIFGSVIHGMDVLERIEKIAADSADRPAQEIKLKSVTIHANPIADAQR